MIKLNNFTQRLLTSIFVGGIFFAIILFAPSIISSLLFCAIALLICFLELPHLASPTTASFWLLCAYILNPFIMLAIINYVMQDSWLTMMFFCIVFANDTGAYIAGNLLGRHLMFPKISPKKTWEGFVGGIFGCFAALAVLQPLIHHANTYNLYLPNKSVPYLFIIACAISSAATLGDFFESWLKRTAGVKDSGSLLPGHGGLFDRFDGIILAIPVFFMLFA